MMSYTRSKEIKFEHDVGCDPFKGCPGHSVQAVWQNSTGLLLFDIDGHHSYTFDAYEWGAMLKAFEALQEVE